MERLKWIDSFLDINDITTDIDSVIRLFADYCVCYREIKGTEDTMKFHEDIDPLSCWARKWGMRFQPDKCNIMPGADPEGVQWGCLNPPFGKNYFIFRGIVVKI